DDQLRRDTELLGELVHPGLPGHISYPFRPSQEPPAPGSRAHEVAPPSLVSPPPGLGMPGANGPAARTRTNTPLSGRHRPRDPGPAARDRARRGRRVSGRSGADPTGAGPVGSRDRFGSVDAPSPIVALSRRRRLRGGRIRRG